MESLTQRQVFGSSRGFEGKNTHCHSVQERASVLRNEALTRSATRVRWTEVLHSKEVKPVLLVRREAFMGFNWEGEMDDLRLHDLRIRTKKFRYSLEIYDRLHDQRLGRLLRRMKLLQDVLGKIHDLYVFGELIRQEQQKWERPRLTVIPLALQKASEMTSKEKSVLYPRVFPLYSRVVNGLPPQLSIFTDVPLVHSA